MTYKMPLRLTILHLEQRFFIEADTFIITSPRGVLDPSVSQSLNYTSFIYSRPDQQMKCLILR